jgi:hypothetical protein
VHNLKVSGPEAPSDRRHDKGLLRRESIVWLAAASILFLAAELTPQLLRMPLGTDEITYIARTSMHVSGVSLPPVHGQGVGLLAAPVTLLTESLTTIRVWMSVLSAIGLFLAMLCWRGLRPAWVLGLAGLIFGSLAISQNSGVQIYPDWWGALGVLALTGLLLHAVNGTMPDRITLPGIAVASLLIVLMRPQNIVFLMGPAILAVIVVRDWRKPKLLVAMGIGTAAALLEWIVGAYLWFGGLASRIHLAGQEPPSLRPYLSLGTQLKVLNGPWYCTPPSGCSGWTAPGESVWWVAFLAVTILGFWLAWRTAAWTSVKTSALLAAATAVWVIALYSFLVPFGAPRYLTPSLALMSILAADGLAWLVTKARWHRTGIVVACLFLVAGIVSQRVILQRDAMQQLDTRPYVGKAQALLQAGVRAPCVLASPPVAYYVGCMAPWTGERIPELLARTPQGLHGWRRVVLLHPRTIVYVPDKPAAGKAG